MFYAYQMRFRFLSVAVFVAVALSGCRQGDGALPVPEGDDAGRITDLEHNLDNISRGDPQASKDLADDLTVYSPAEPDAKAAVAELANRTAAALSGRSLSEAATEELARQLWMTVRATELSERQVQSLQAEVQTGLTAAGVPMDRVEPLTTQIAEVQRFVGQPRRWYQWF